MNKLALVILAALPLIGCGGGSDDNPETPPPVVDPEITPPVTPETDLPLTPLEPSITPPTTVCGENSTDENCINVDESFTNPSLPMIPVDPSQPVIPPTTDCGDNGECLEDDFFNPSEVIFDIAAVSKMLNVDQIKLSNICNYNDNICHMVEDKPVITVKDYWYSNVSYFPMQGYALMNGQLQTNGNYCAESFKLDHNFWNTSGHHVTDVKTEIADCIVKYQAIIDLNPDNILEDILGQRASYLMLNGELTYQGFSPIQHSDTQWLYVGGTDSGHLNNILEIMSVDRRSNK